MKVLVTGGAGFIGSHVVDGYINGGHDVVVLDDFSSGKRENVNVQAEFVRGSITDQGFLQTVFKQHGPFDLVNHHAAQKSISRSINDPAFDAEVNILGTLNLLERMRKNSVKRFIFASTGGALYKEGCELPAEENAEIEPISPYAIAKYSIENYLAFYRKLGFITQTLRYANVYGPRQDPEGEAGVVAIFCSRLLQNKPLIINSDGLQTRDFIYVDDIVSANMRVITHSESGTWNVGTGHETSVLDVAHVLSDAAAQHNLTVSAIEHAPAQPGEMRRSVLASQRAQDSLEWVAQVELKVGLRRVLDSFLNNESSHG